MHSNRRGKWGHQGGAAGCSKTVYRENATDHIHPLMSLKKCLKSKPTRESSDSQGHMEVQNVRQILHLHSVPFNSCRILRQRPWGWVPVGINYSRQKEQWCFSEVIGLKAGFLCQLWDLGPVISITCLRAETPILSGVGDCVCSAPMTILLVW